MSGERRKFTDCRPQDLEKLLQKLGGFELIEGSKHTKARHIATWKMTTIPRHPRLNPNLVRDVVEDFLIADCGYPAAKVYETLDC